MKKIKKAVSLVLTLCMVFSMAMNVSAANITIGTKPADGTTTGQPFSSGTGGSTNFRIPSLVTLSDGTLVAAADARWNHAGDGYGLDTIVSRSSDSGANWNYTFANYLGDNGNAYNADSTAFIDPALAVTSDNTIYMLVDLYPHGTFIGNVKAGTGFDSNGHLLLSNNDGSSYDYYVGDFTNGSANIYQSDGTQVADYTVDDHYNITGSNVNTNLFFSDSPYQVLPTSYLYLTKSTDGGATWSAPMMLNSQVKNSGDMFYGVGPGRGLVTSTGRIIFPCYTYTSQDGNTSVIYSDDGGTTWTRSAGMTSQSSEAALAEADGRIYMFTRHGGYYVSADKGTTWGGKQSVGLSYNTGCQISALTYSKKIDGKTAILLSAPSSTSSRSNGKIYVGLVQDDGSINWKYTYSVNNSTYQYSCLTELNDGSIGLLYENGNASITYTNLAIAQVASGATIGESTSSGDNNGTNGSEENTEAKTEDIVLYVGQTTVEKDTTGNYESSYTGEGLDTTKATVSVKGDDGTASSVTYTAASVSCNDLISSDSSNWVAASGYYYKADDGNYYPVYAKRTKNWFTYNYTWGYSKTDSMNNVTEIKTQNLVLSSDNSNITVYTESPVEATSASTTITFKGVTAGTTSVKVGNTVYNITVKDLPDYVDTETTPFVSNTGVGDGKAITKLTTSVGLTFDIDLNITGSDVEWSIADTSIATVDQNGNVTGVSAGETTLTVTVDGVSYTMPVVIRQDATSSATKIYDFYLSEVTDTTVYMSISTSTDLVEVQEGEAIYISFNSNADTAVDFFGTPHEGYALTRMSSTNSAGDYMALNSTDPTQTDFYTKDGAAGKNQRNTFGNTAVANMVQAALNKDCDGGMGWTRPSGNTNGVTSDLTFRSEKLPTVEKEVASVNGVAYSEGMVAHVGEKVVFNVTITQYAAQDDITYSSVALKDNLNGAVFAGSSSASKTITDLSNTAVTSDTTYTYQVEYTITDADLDKTIVNTVDLTYTYKSAYSSGSFGGTANADAKFTAASFNPQDIVIDFGLPVTIDYSGANAHGRYDLASGTATYGDVSVSDNKVTYTPTEVLKAVDTVTLTNTAGGTYTFKVYPATTVYYEEGYASLTGNGWTGGNKGTGTQDASFVGSKDHYGYDSKYAKEANGASNGTQATSTAIGDDAVFTFTGTGVDIYANCTTETGSVNVLVRNSTGSIVKLLKVDTKTGEGGSATQEQDVTSYSLPIVSLSGLASDTYTVTIRHCVTDANETAHGNVNLDGFKVFGTIDENAAVYADDGEQNPNYTEVRNSVLKALEVTQSTSEVYAGELAGQVYDQVDGQDGAVIISKNVTDNAQDLLDNGPKNEIFLRPGESLAFSLGTGITSAQIGLKAVSSNVNYKINNGSEQTMTTSTDMFYKLEGCDGGDSVTITNVSGGILSITDLKWFGNLTSSTAMAAPTVATFRMALMSLGYAEESVTADANLNISVVDYSGAELASTSLTATGAEGEENVFASADILEAAKAVLPDGYAFADEAAVTDQSVAYGADGAVTVQAGKVATLNVTYKKLFGKSVGTATLTKVQTSSSSKASFTASDIRAAAPEGYTVMTLLGTSVKYGSSGTKTVYVY